MHHIDFLRHTIELGDDVVYAPTKNAPPLLGKVLSFCPKYVTIFTSSGNHSVSPDRLVVVTDQILVNKLKMQAAPHDTR